MLKPTSVCHFKKQPHRGLYRRASNNNFDKELINKLVKDGQ
jgi:hypothetical protein